MSIVIQQISTRRLSSKQQYFHVRKREQIIPKLTKKNNNEQDFVWSGTILIWRQYKNTLMFDALHCC